MQVVGAVLWGADKGNLPLSSNPSTALSHYAEGQLILITPRKFKWLCKRTFSWALEIEFEVKNDRVRGREKQHRVAHQQLRCFHWFRPRQGEQKDANCHPKRTKDSEWELGEREKDTATRKTWQIIYYAIKVSMVLSSHLMMVIAELSEPQHFFPPSVFRILFF
jgi:hypothetical protein